MVCLLFDRQDTANAGRKHFVCSRPLLFLMSYTIRLGPGLYIMLADTLLRWVKIPVLVFAGDFKFVADVKNFAAQRSRLTYNALVIINTLVSFVWVSMTLVSYMRSALHDRYGGHCQAAYNKVSQVTGAIPVCAITVMVSLW